MKKLITILFFTLYMGAAYAELSFGVSGAITQIDASGTETEGGETNRRGDIDNVVVVPSLFVEYGITDRITIGVDYIPVSADVSDKTYKRTDVETSVTGTTTTTSTSRTQTADAELEDHISVYADVMLSDNAYVKVGGVQVELNTKESLGTGSKYGNETIDGILIGFGVKTDSPFGKFMKVELIHTNYDEVSITSSVARTGVTTNNKIDADLDTTALKVSFAF